MSPLDFIIHNRGVVAEKPRVVRAVRILRRMRGCAQADLVETDDGWYVVKWQQNAQHPRILVNEVFAGELLRRLGVSTPAWAVVEADKAFLNRRPEARIQLADRSVPVELGPHFGSRTPGDPFQKKIYDFLPYKLAGHIENLRDFMTCLVFDRWVDHSDTRQAIFVNSHQRRWFAAYMIDNGHTFGFDGLDWQLRDRPAGANRSAIPLPVYFSRQAEIHISEAVEAVRAISWEDLQHSLDLTPPQWVGNDRPRLNKICAELIGRQTHLPGLIDDTIACLFAERRRWTYENQQ